MEAMRDAAPWSLTFLTYRSMPLEPSSYRIVAERTASAPKTVANAALRASGVSPLKDFRRLPASLFRPTNLPVES